jgi:Transport and Golgi organisation 2
MCTAILSTEPGAPVLLAGVRDELADRAWRPPGRHWPDYPGLIGGLDLLAGGTWLAVAPAAPRVACVLNGRGRQAPARSRRSRGLLPLQAAASGKLERGGIGDFDPFHLLSVEPGLAVLWSWDGERLTERDLASGVHVVVNSGLASDPAAGNARGPGRQPGGQEPGGQEPGGQEPGGQEPGGQEPGGSDHERARVAHFLPRLRAADRPLPRPGAPVRQAWGAWLPLLNGAGIHPGDPRALIVRRDLGDGRVWGTTSVSLVAMSADGLRYDFSGAPGGEPAVWHPVSLDRAA